MKQYDIAVVGGGPVGCYVAKKVASKGFKVSLFEEHNEIGKPLKCAGLVSSRVFDFFDNNKKNVLQNEIYGARINSPSGNVLTIGGDKIHAFVIDRSQFDKEIADRAKDKGAEIFLDNKVTFAKKEKNHALLNIKQKREAKEIQSSLLIGADGPHSKIRESFKFDKPKEFLLGIGAEVINIDMDPRFVEIFVGQDIAPGFFAWGIPTNKDGTRARIGLCINNNFKNTLKNCFANLLKVPQLQNGKITSRIGGVIPLGPLKKTVESNVMLVGDAAAQVKPTSGGGIYPGLVCASCCSSVALEALDKNDFSIQILKKYHNMWSNEIGRELSLGMRFRTIFRNLNDKQIEAYIRKINNKKTIDIICKYGDIDYPSKLALPILKRTPSFVKLLPSALKKTT